MINTKKIAFASFLLLWIFTTIAVFPQTKINGSEEQIVCVDDTTNSKSNLKDLIRLVAYNKIEEVSNGEYIKGIWEEVKNAKKSKITYWSYPTGVSLYALQRVYKILNDEKIINYVNNDLLISANVYEYLRWQKYKFGTIYNTQNLGKLWRLNMLDDCGVMGAALLESLMNFNLEPTTEIKQLVEIISNFVINVQARLYDKTFWRPKSPNSPSIWADDLFMSLPFLIKWSQYSKDKSYLTDAAYQVVSFASYLQDSIDGVWFHGYYVEKKERTCCKWGRGNGWVAIAITELLSALPENHKFYNQVLDIYKRQMSGIKKYQDDDGLWNQVLDHPELSFGTETSCSAQFAYAIARGINRGWLVKKNYINVINHALAGLKSRITKNGAINKVCKSTSLGDSLEYYNSRPIRDNDYHGNGLMLMALTEIYYLQKEYK